MLSIRGHRVVLPTGEQSASIHIDNGIIVAVRDHADVGSASESIDADPFVIMPGLVDSHVHVNEPGRTDWEGFDTATRAAAAGGVTKILGISLNRNPGPTTGGRVDAT